MPTLVTDLDLPEFDPADTSLSGDGYHDRLAELRAQSWIAKSPLGYVVLDHAGGETFLRSKQAEFPGHKLAELFQVEGALREEMDRNILHINGDDHRRLRNLVNPSLTPKAADTWRPAMRGFLHQLWDDLDGATSCDFVEKIAQPYPSLTIANFMGAPLEDAPRLHFWSNMIQRQFDAPSLMNDRDQIEAAVVEFYAYCYELLAERRGNPGDDLVSKLLVAEEEGDRLSDVECVNLVLNVLIGGVDTTQAQLAHAVRVLARHPEQWTLLAERPELARNAVSEALRYEPITAFTARITTEEMEVADVLFPKDTIVMVCAATGNREFDGGDSFDITRDDSPRLMTFGAGIHFCVGSNLARAELEEALTFLAPRMPGLTLDGDPVYGTVQGIYGLEALPVRWS